MRQNKQVVPNMIKVYHFPDILLTQIPVRSAKLAEFVRVRFSAYTAVAEVDTAFPAQAVKLTRSVTTVPWWKNPHVRFLGSPTFGMNGCRSTVHGDVLEMADGHKLIVDTEEQFVPL